MCVPEKGQAASLAGDSFRFGKLRQNAAQTISPIANDDTLVLDMGEFLFEDFGQAELGLDQHAGNAILKGINLMQILPGGLSKRAGFFPALGNSCQVGLLVLSFA